MSIRKWACFGLCAFALGCGGSGSYKKEPSAEELKAMNEQMSQDMAKMTGQLKKDLTKQANPAAGMGVGKTKK